MTNSLFHFGANKNLSEPLQCSFRTLLVLSSIFLISDIFACTISVLNLKTLGNAVGAKPTESQIIPGMFFSANFIIFFTQSFLSALMLIGSIKQRSLPLKISNIFSLFSFPFCCMCLVYFIYYDVSLDFLTISLITVWFSNLVRHFIIFALFVRIRKLKKTFYFSKYSKPRSSIRNFANSTMRSDLLMTCGGNKRLRSNRYRHEYDVGNTLNCANKEKYSCGSLISFRSFKPICGRAEASNERKSINSKNKSDCFTSEENPSDFFKDHDSQHFAKFYSSKVSADPCNTFARFKCSGRKGKSIPTKSHPKYNSFEDTKIQHLKYLEVNTQIPQKESASSNVSNPDLFCNSMYDKNDKPNKTVELKIHRELDRDSGIEKSSSRKHNSISCSNECDEEIVAYIGTIPWKKSIFELYNYFREIDQKVDDLFMGWMNSGQICHVGEDEFIDSIKHLSGANDPIKSLRSAYIMILKLSHQSTSPLGCKNKLDLTGTLKKYLDTLSITCQLVEGYKKVCDQNEPKADCWLVVKCDDDMRIVNLPLDNRTSGLISAHDQEFYFLSEPNDHNFIHHPRHYQHQLLKKKVSSKIFYELAYTSPEFHISGFKLSSGNLGIIKQQIYDVKLKFSLSIERLPTKEPMRKFVKACFTSQDELEPASGHFFVACTANTFKILGELPRSGKYKVEISSYTKEPFVLSRNPMIIFYIYTNHSASKSHLQLYSRIPNFTYLLGLQPIHSLLHEKIVPIRQIHEVLQKSFRSVFLSTDQKEISIAVPFTTSGKGSYRNAACIPVEDFSLYEFTLYSLHPKQGMSRQSASKLLVQTKANSFEANCIFDSANKSKESLFVLELSYDGLAVMRWLIEYKDLNSRDGQKEKIYPRTTIYWTGCYLERCMAGKLKRKKKYSISISTPKYSTIKLESENNSKEFKKNGENKFWCTFTSPTNPKSPVKIFGLSVQSEKWFQLLEYSTS